MSYTPCELPPHKLGALDVAQHLGVSPQLVYKTIVATRPAGGKPILALVPGPNELDLKALAKALSEKKVKLATHHQAEELTGLQTGGISPLALLHRPFQVVVDQSAQVHAEIYISGGQRGLNLRLRVDDLVRLTNARLTPISR